MRIWIFSKASISTDEPGYLQETSVSKGLPCVTFRTFEKCISIHDLYEKSHVQLDIPFIIYHRLLWEINIYIYSINTVYV